MQTTRHLRALPGTPAEPRLLTVVEAARELRVSRSTVYTLIRDGKLRTVKMGTRTTRIATEDLEACVQALRAEGR